MRRPPPRLTNKPPNKGVKQAPPVPSKARQQRSASALRDNLHRRKNNSEAKKSEDNG
ncbi:MAG: hypothetical protein HAW65_06685 [Alphaproteobacteria bacterium]|nr:hypothetical protein [Alphaproteobacteria bacterium]MBE8220973.1 hypothetical protein [Alphaproteobacteria bacterium]